MSTLEIILKVVDYRTVLNNSYLSYFTLHVLIFKLANIMHFKANIHCDSKRCTQLNSKRRLNTLQTVGCGIPSSLLALRFDLRGLCSKFSLEFVSRSPLTHPVGRSFDLYTDSLFAQTGDSNDKCSSSLEVEC